MVKLPFYPPTPQHLSPFSPLLLTDFFTISWPFVCYRRSTPYHAAIDFDEHHGPLSRHSLGISLGSRHPTHCPEDPPSSVITAKTSAAVLATVVTPCHNGSNAAYSTAVATEIVAYNDLIVFRPPPSPANFVDFTHLDPLPTLIVRQQSSSLPEPVGFQAKFQLAMVAVAAIVSTDMFTIAGSTDFDHQPARPYFAANHRNLL